MGWVFFSVISTQVLYQITTSLKSPGLSTGFNQNSRQAGRGFAVQDLCALKGVHLNRPAQKMSDQFKQAEVASNFDITSTRIHVEGFIGRVREWSILNAVWPVQRMDLLSSTWQALCHIVNLTMPPIGPRENK